MRKAAPIHQDRKCKHCQEVLPIDKFAVWTTESGAPARRGVCISCTKSQAIATSKRWRDKNLDRDRASHAARYRAKAEIYKKKSRDYYHKNKSAARNSRILRQYGIGDSEYQQILAKQNFSCAICGTKDPGKKGFQIDHCHSTGIIRGILCGKCNLGIGIFGDSTEVLLRAAGYVSFHSQENHGGYCGAG